MKKKFSRGERGLTRQEGVGFNSFFFFASELSADDYLDQRR